MMTPEIQDAIVRVSEVFGLGLIAGIGFVVLVLLTRGRG